MSESSPPTPRRGSRTFRAACAVLATVAAAQAAATAWSSKTREALARLEPQNMESGQPRERARTEKQPPSDPFSPDFHPQDPHPELTGPAGEAPAEDPALAALQPVITIPRPKAAAPLDVPITDEEVLEHLDAALHLKSQGDMHGALERFRAALKKIPQHPKLLYHAAQTLDTMGLPHKAAPLWKTLHKLGGTAGNYFLLAQDRIANGPQAVAEPEEDEKEGLFTVADLTDEKISDVSGGERVRITAVLQKHTPEPVDLSKDMVLATHFFDSVNGRRIARSQVGQPAVECVSLPLDWEDGKETFTFEYWQPDMTPEEILRWGRCRYYGCTLEVFYRERLQDSAATTQILLALARELPVPAPEPEASILEGAPDPGGGAESGLFPPQLLKP
jgi:hypothetical protein